MRRHGKQVKMNLSSGARNDSQVVSRFSCIDSRGRSLSVWPEESRGTREKLFDLGHGHSMGGDFEPWRLGAWAAPHETIPSHCVWVLMCDSTKTENGCGACRRPRRRVTLCLSLGLLDVNARAIKGNEVGGLA